MRFLVDAQLPKSLSAWLRTNGHDSIHTLELPQRNATADESIIQVAKDESRIVISKDSDFFETFLVRKEPAQLLIVSTGNITNKDLRELFRANLNKLVSLFESHEVVEMNSETIIVHY